MAQAKRSLAAQTGRPRTTVQIPHASPAHDEIARRKQDASRGYGATYNAVSVLALERYFDALRYGRAQARRLFDQEALEFIADVLGGDRWDAAALAGLSKEVERKAQTRRANSAMLRVAETLRDASMDVLLALADAAEEYRRHPRRYSSLLDSLNRLDVAD
jgi:hypothetical protein